MLVIKGRLASSSGGDARPKAGIDEHCSKSYSISWSEVVEIRRIGGLTARLLLTLANGERIRISAGEDFTVSDRILREWEERSAAAPPSTSEDRALAATALKVGDGGRRRASRAGRDLSG